MEFQFAKKELNCLSRVLWEVKNQEQTLEIKVGDAMPDVGKVLGAWGQPILRGKEWRGSSMGVSGGVQVWVLYKGEGEEEIRQVEGWMPFQIRWDFPQTQRDGTMRVSCMLQSLDARITSARKVMVRCVVSALAEALEPVRKELRLPEAVPEDVQLLRRSYPICLPKEAGEKNIDLDEELQLPGSLPSGSKLLLCTALPELVDQKLLGDKVVFRGALLLHGLAAGEDGSLKSVDWEVPFSQYAQLEQDYGESACPDVMPALTDLETELTGEGKIRLKAGITGQYVVYDRPLVEVVEDAYSVRRDIQLQTDALSLPAVLETRQLTVNAAQPLQIQDGTVTDVSFMAGHPQVRSRGQNLEMELSGTFQALGNDDSGQMQTQTLRWEETVTESAGETAQLLAWGSPTGKPYWEGGTVHGDFSLNLMTVTETKIPTVTGLVLGENKTPDAGRPSLILCTPGQEGLWSLAKRCGSTVEAIEQANALQEEPEPDRMLLIPVI